MSAYEARYVRPAASPLSRGVAFLGYGLLFCGLPTLGTSALLGLVIAYAQRDGAGPLIGSHYRYQIRLFWIGIAMGAAALALAATAVVDAAHSPQAPLHVPVSPHATLVSWSADEPPLVDRPHLRTGLGDDLPSFTYRFSTHALQWRTRALLEGYGAAVLGLFSVIWAFGAPLYGAARLASGRGMGQSPQ
jgi:hypothetical protein